MQRNNRREFPASLLFQVKERHISFPELRRTFKKSKPINKQLTPDDEFLPEPARLKSRFRGRKRVPLRDGGGGMQWIIIYNTSTQGSNKRGNSLSDRPHQVILGYLIRVII